MGNTVVLKPAEYTSLTALLFADLCREAGLPKGVVNIVTGDGAVGEMIVTHPDIDKIAFTGSTDVGRRIRQATAGSGKALTLELGGKSPYIVFDDADLDSAVEGLVDAIWFNQGQVCCAGSRLIVQEGIADRFYEKLKRRMDGLRLGDPLDKCIDVGAVVDSAQLHTITEMVASATGEVYHADTPLPAQGCYYKPTLITGLEPSDWLMQEEIFGPVLVATTFRTPADAVALANNTRYGLAATVWSENINLALDIAPKLAAGVVWVNATNLFDAAAGFGGVRESGFGREGGWEGLRAYTRRKGKPKDLKPIYPVDGPAKPDIDSLDRTAKAYIGGKQARPDGGYSRAVWSSRGRLLGHMPLANRKDIRNAVEAARGASGWSKTTGHLRAQILYYLAENLSARTGEFTDRIRDLTGAQAKTAKARGRDQHPPPVHLCRLGRQIRRRGQGRPPARHRSGDERTRRRDRGVLPRRGPAAGADLGLGPGDCDGQPHGSDRLGTLPAGRDGFLPGARYFGRPRRCRQHPDRQPCRTGPATGRTHGCRCGLELFLDRPFRRSSSARRRAT